MQATETKGDIEAGAKSDMAATSKPGSGLEQRRSSIATLAYFKAQARGFAPGRELDDWLQAEAEMAEREVAA